MWCLVLSRFPWLEEGAWLHRLSEVGVPSERVEGGQDKNRDALKLSPPDPKGLAWMLRGTPGNTNRGDRVACGDRKQSRLWKLDLETFHVLFDKHW